MNVRKVFKAIMLAVFLLATLNFAWEFYQFHLQQSELTKACRETGFCPCFFGPPIEIHNRFLIEVLLLIAFISSRFKNVFSYALYSSGLILTLFIYKTWWQVYFNVMESSGASDDAIEHFAYLWGGNALDVYIAITTAISSYF